MSNLGQNIRDLLKSSKINLWPKHKELMANMMGFDAYKDIVT